MLTSINIYIYIYIYIYTGSHPVGSYVARISKHRVATAWKEAKQLTRNVSNFAVFNTRRRTKIKNEN